MVAGKELTGLRFSGCAFYRGELGAAIYTGAHVGDIWFTGGSQFNSVANGQRVFGSTFGSGVIDNLMIEGIDFRALNPDIYAVEFYNPTENPASITDVSVIGSRFANMRHAARFTNVRGIVFADNRLLAMGGLNGARSDTLALFDNCSAVTVTGNAGYNASGLGYSLTSLAKFTGASDYLIAANNVYQGLSGASAIVDASSGANKVLSPNVP